MTDLGLSQVDLRCSLADLHLSGQYTLRKIICPILLLDSHLHNILGCSPGSSLMFAEIAGAHPRFTAEIAAKGGLLVKAQHVGDGLHREVVPHVQQQFGFLHNVVTYPIGGRVTSLLLDNSTEVFGRQAGLLGIEAYITMLAEMLYEVVLKPCADLFVYVRFVQFARAVLAE